MVGHLALGIASTRGIWPLTRVLALVVKASQMIGTLGVAETLPAPAGYQSIARVTTRTSADWPSISRPV